jgi:hypothetical protein
MRTVPVLLPLAILAALLPSAILAEAQPATPSAAPGGGHGFLIDPHVAAGVACDGCHTERLPTPPTVATCLGCHGGSYPSLAAKTAQDQPNPHQSHQGEVPCAACHHVHAASVTFCNRCHSFDMTTP